MESFPRFLSYCLVFEPYRIGFGLALIHMNLMTLLILFIGLDRKLFENHSKKSHDRIFVHFYHEILNVNFYFQDLMLVI